MPTPTSTKIAFMADQGEASVRQTELANAINAYGPDIVIAGGDNNYETGSAATIDANWAEFDSYILSQTVFPAFGNHDLDSGLAIQPAKFPYLPGNKRYYHITSGDVDIFVLNSGKDTSGTVIEPDGITKGSNQHIWFLNALANSTKKFKIVVMHHTFLTRLSGGSAKIVPELDWDFDELGIDIILNGDTHTAQHLRRGELNLIDASSAVRDPRNMSNSGTFYGGEPGDQLVWAYAPNGAAGGRYFATLDQNGDSLLVAMRNVATGEQDHVFEIVKQDVSDEYRLENIGGVLTLTKNGVAVSEVPLAEASGIPTDIEVNSQIVVMTQGAIQACGCGCAARNAEPNDIIVLGINTLQGREEIYAKVLKANRDYSSETNSFVYTLGLTEVFSEFGKENIECIKC